MYQGSFEDVQNNLNFRKRSLFQVHQVLVNQDLQKIWQEELTSLTARVSIQFTYCSNGKRWKDI